MTIALIILAILLLASIGVNVYTLMLLVNIKKQIEKING